jgi:hypothetical protein
MTEEAMMMRMFCFGKRSITIDLALAATLFLSLFLLPARVRALEVGDNAPDFQAVTIKGKNISYDKDFKGKKAVYLIFWATW